MVNDESDVKPVYRKTCRRYDEPGDVHYLTFSCFQRRPFLSRPRTCRWFIDAIEAAREKHQFDLWAFVIMPEHVHMLIYPRRPAYSISSILSSLKIPVTRRAERFVREQAPEFAVQMTDRQPNGKTSLRFWQSGGGYDRNLWSPKHIWEAIDYIHDNPVRRDLCESPLDWPWSSVLYYEDRESGPLRIDLDSLPDDRCRGRKRY